MPLLERDTELDSLRSLMELVPDEGRIALVSGEAGIGKTALVETFARDVTAGRTGPRVLTGRCDALFTPRPLGPLLDIARQTGGRPAAATGGDREGVFGSFLDVCAREPVVVLIEDAHWADEATLDLLRYTGRRIRGTHALLIVTYRDDEIGPRHPLRPALPDFPRDSVTRIPLKRLSPEAVRALARSADRSDAGLHQASNGNPFFVTEVLAGDGAGVPASVRDAVLARARKLDDRARRVLDLVSIVPGRTEARLLDAVFGDRVPVAECRNAGMLQSADGLISFRHELARKAWEDSLEAGYARDLHARVGHALLDRVGDLDRARVVHHAARAGDADAVLRHAPQAAREAESVGAHLQAADLYGEAARHADRLAVPDRARLFDEYA